MPEFEYKGISGEKNTYADGVIEAINEDEAAHRLRQQKIIITSIKLSKKQKIVKKEKADGESFLDRFGSVKPKDVAIFSKKLSTMSRAGLPILDALQMAQDQIDDKKLKKIVTRISADLQGGNDLSTCCARHPKVFDNIYVNRGPGSFSSIRVSLSVAKGIQISKGAKLYGYKDSSLCKFDAKNINLLIEKSLLESTLIKPIYLS